MKINVILTVVLALNVLFVHSQNSDEESNGELDEEYTESEYQDPPANTYFSERSITTGITEYKVTKTQTCNEQQDFYYEYTGVYECEPVVAESYRVTVNIHMNEPEYDEAKITMKNLASGEVSDFDIEYVEEYENGLITFDFSIVNQPHQIILNRT